MFNGYSADTSKLKWYDKILCWIPFFWAPYFPYIQKVGTGWERPGWMDSEDIPTHWDVDSPFNYKNMKLNFEATDLVSLTRDYSSYKWKFRIKGLTQEVHHSFVADSFIKNNQKKYGKLQVGVYFALAFFLRKRMPKKWNPFPKGWSCTEIAAGIEEAELVYLADLAKENNDALAYRMYINDLNKLRERNLNNYNSLQYLLYKLTNESSELVVCPAKYRGSIKIIYHK